VTSLNEAVDMGFGIFGRVNVIALLGFVFLIIKSVILDVPLASNLIPLEAAAQDVIALGIPIPLGKPTAYPLLISLEFTISTEQPSNVVRDTLAISTSPVASRRVSNR